VDPNLPPELLAEDWLGNDASQFFQTHAALLASQANTYVDDVIAAGPGNNVK
jgi:DNA-binding transcriptional regulator PaaX